MKLIPLLLASAALVAGGLAQAQNAAAPAGQTIVLRASKVGEIERDGTTALHWAAYNEDVAAAKALIAAGANVKATNRYGSTPIALAAENGNAELIRLLLDGGADVESPNPDGQTILMVVARTGNVEAARLLLDRGANPNTREQWRGQTALMWAAANHHADMIRLLGSRGADPNVKAWENPSEIRNTVEPRPKDVYNGGLSAPGYAGKEGCEACIAALKEIGADLDIPDPEGLTPLILALSNFQWDTAKELILAGADVNRWDIYGRAPLFTAVLMSVTPDGSGRPEVTSADDTQPHEIAEMLLERGANPNMATKLGLPLRMVVQDRGFGPSAGSTPLYVAAQLGNFDMIPVLMRHGARADIAVGGSYPLHKTFTGVAPTQSGSDRLMRTKTPEKALRALEVFLESGGDPNLKNNNGEAALHIAAQAGNDAAVTILARHGADLQIKDATGRTPLDYAAGTNLPVRAAAAGGGGRGGGGGGAVPAPVARESTVALIQRLIAGGAVATATTTPAQP